MARRRYRLGGFGASDSDHASVGKRHIDDAWNDLERMPPTCQGGIDVAARALASAERGLAHLHAIEDRSTRAANDGTIGLGHRAANAASKTITFFAGVCKAPGGEARERPLFSRGKVAAEIAAQERKNKRKKRS